MKTAQAQRPKWYDLNLAHLPVPGLVSIFHRISGALLFLALPVLLYLLQATLASEAGWLHWKAILAMGPVKLAAIGLAWLYCHHFFAGIRYLLLDVHVGVGKEPARASARAVFVLGALAALGFAWRIW
ncbi:MAG TPA: succinate dehydrogenase, cytochrome b556 subunit [Usitatibacteraceae bacterium]|nr:succinate dehydrogenase, cytochrome b556 subunit [Usitatibacteraceae bacterium]